jgi:transcriptional regulator with AAA-type ATPase domain/tetratricopeptide (TPR) repeat protein
MSVIPVPELLGDSEAIQAVNAEIEQILGSDARRRRVPPVLIEGETGTGKGLLARVLHAKSSRRAGPLVEINCAAIPAHLLEAELLGFERGAFTDARQAKPGLFEVANGGTLFLDEVALLAKDLQGKVLTVVESGLVRRIGSTRSEPVDIWIIAASNEDLRAAVREARFREDLYHRLAVVTLRLPPLRERDRDILALAEHFLGRACAEYEIARKRFGADAEERLLTHPWPGNVRELRNVIERTVLLSRAPVISADDLRLPLDRLVVSTAAEETTDADPEAAVLTRTLEATAWNVSKAAAALGISRNTLRHRIAKYGLVPRVSFPFRRGSRLPPRGEAPAPAPPAVAEREPAKLAPPGPEMAEVRYTHRNVAFLRVLVPPEIARDPAAPRMIEIVDKVVMYGGRVAERGASGILAVFGLAGGENVVLRAAFAAIAIVDMTRPPGDPSPRPRTALAVRDCPIVWTDDEATVDLDAKLAVWQTLNGLLAEAPAVPIVVHTQAVPFLERRLEVRALADAADGLHELTGQPAAPLGRRGALVPFVGREHELELLQGAVTRLVRGGGRAITVVGEPGIGKSRLLFEFRRPLDPRAVRVIDVRCHPHTAKVPYSVAVDVLRQLCGIDDSMDRAEALERLRGELEELGIPHQADVHLYELLGLRDSPAGSTPYNAEPRIRQVVQSIVERSCLRQPLVLIVDDAHWVDKASERCLAGITGALDHVPLLLVTTRRPGPRPAWAGAAYSAEVALSPLSRDEAHTLLLRLAAREWPQTTVTRILETADGNPFFLEELVRAFPDQVAEGAGVVLPGTVQEAVLGRVDQLDRATRQVLHTHAVFGRSAATRILESVCGVADLKGALDTLVGDEFLVEDLRADEPTYRLKHAVTQQVVYESLPLAERTAIHGTCGEALERLWADRLDEVADALSYHYVNAGIPDKALTYLTLLADAAARRHDHAAALDTIDEALRLARTPAAEIDDRDRVIIGLVIQRARCLHFLGGFTEMLQMFVDHRPTLLRANDKTQEAEFSFLLARNYGMLGRSAETTAAAAEAITAARAAGDDTMLGRAYYVLALEYSWLGRSVESIAHARQAVGLLRSVGDQDWEGQAHWVLGFSHGFLGEIDAALAAEAEARAIARSIGDLRLESYANWTTGFIYACVGRTREATEHCDRALQTAVDPHNVPIARGFLGYVYLQRGDMRRAIALLEPCVKDTLASGFARFYASVCTWLAEALLREGAAGHAGELAGAALETARRSGHIVGEGWARRVLGMAAYAADDLAEAEARLRDALRLFTSIQAPLERARTLLALAEVATARGHAESAASALNDARAALMVPALAAYRDYVWETVGPEWSRALRAIRGRRS